MYNTNISIGYNPKKVKSKSLIAWQPCPMGWGGSNKEQLDSFKTRHYNHLEENEANNMSIVGFLRCKDGVLAFSDSKSSLNFEVQKGRENIDKIFSNSSIVVANYGQNSFNDLYFENFIPELLKDKNINNYSSFINKFVSYVSENVGIDAYFKGNFLVFEKDSNLMFSIKHNENCDGLIREGVFDETFSYLIGGNEYYINCLMELFETKIDLCELSCEEAIKIVNEELSKIIKILDSVPYNNPCGLPIKFYCYKK